MEIKGKLFEVKISTKNQKRKHENNQKQLRQFLICNFLLMQNKPLTLSSAECSAVPALFTTMHLNIPRCMPSTLLIFNELVRWFNLMIVMPFSPDTIGDEFRTQRISIGKSPLLAIHWIPTLSPVFVGSSPNANGIICGETVDATEKKIIAEITKKKVKSIE